MDDALWDTIATETDANPQEIKKLDVNYLPDGQHKIHITKSGAFIKFEYLGEDYLKIAKRIENYFTLRAKTIMGVMKCLNCSKMDKANKRIIIPRFGVYEILNNKHHLNNFTTISNISPGETPNCAFEWRGALTDNQILIYNEIIENYYSDERCAIGSAGVIVNLEAGQGKSYLAAYLISVLQKKTAIILHSTALLEQWVKVLQTALGPAISIGYYYTKKKVLGDIMIFIVDSAANDQFIIAGETIAALDLYNRFGFVILDECHMYSNKTALKALKSAQAPYMLGLSATPDEHVDGYDKAVWWAIGPVLDASKLSGYIATSDDFTAEVHRIMYYGSNEYTKLIVNKATDMTSTSETINMICKDKIRNSIIIDCICEGLDLGLCMFVFADRRQYLADLQKELVTTKQITGEIIDSDADFVRIVGGAKYGELENAELKSKVIFTTYQYMGTGKSVVKMNGLVLATPRKTKMKQYINRIFRLGSDMSIKRHIWDICDMRLKMSNQWRIRLIHYNSKKYTITQKKIKYTDVSLEAIPLDHTSSDTEHKILENKPDIQNEYKNKHKKVLSIADSLIARIKASK